jgi:hypothetical protein
MIINNMLAVLTTNGPMAATRLVSRFQLAIIQPGEQQQLELDSHSAPPVIIVLMECSQIVLSALTAVPQVRQLVQLVLMVIVAPPVIRAPRAVFVP